MSYSIAIDGPSGAGKSTMAKAVAKALGFIYVDTGAIYRSVGLYVLNKGVDKTDSEKVISMLPEINVNIQYVEDGSQHMILNGVDVSDKIRTPEVSMYASAVSAIPEVRAFLLEMQRKLARENNVIMDGRDIGTVVLPNADVKVFLTASDEERARRRFVELQEKGTKTTFEEVLNDMRVRDHNDSTRSAAPLKQADDAVLFDCSSYNVEESKDFIMNLVKEKLGI